MLIITVFHILCFVASSFSYKFLIYNPMMAVSHMKFLSSIADILTERGHNVTVLMQIQDQSLEDKTFLKLTTDVIKVPCSPEATKMRHELMKGVFPSMWTEERGALSNMRMFEKFRPLTVKFCRDIASNTRVMNQLKERHFDVGIAEPLSVCGFGIFDELGIPASIAASSLPPMEDVNLSIGQPVLPSYVPGWMSTSGDRMNFLERIQNVFATYGNIFVSHRKYSGEEFVLREVFGEGVKNYQTLFAEASFQFINSHPLMDFPFPTLQKNIQIGGISTELRKSSTQQLSEEWDNLLNLRNETVLISFGSIAKSAEMPPDYKNAFLRLFASMPNTTFIWKYEEDTPIADHLDNVILVKWMPQDQLLRDPRLSMFVSHGGIGSTTELAYSGTPAVMIPLLFDQARNAYMLSRHEGAIVLSKFELDNSDKIEKAFIEVLRTESYRKNAQRLAEMLNNCPVSSKNLVIKYCEFTAKFGKQPQLDPYGRHLSFWQYFLVDILLTFIAGFASIVGLFYYLISIICARQKQKML